MHGTPRWSAPRPPLIILSSRCMYVCMYDECVLCERRSGPSFAYREKKHDEDEVSRRRCCCASPYVSLRVGCHYHSYGAVWFCLVVAASGAKPSSPARIIPMSLMLQG